MTQVEVCVAKICPPDKAAKGKTPKKKAAPVAEEGDEDPVDVLVDILLSLLADGSSLVREMANRGFS